MDPAEHGPARDRLLFQLKTKGPQTAAELARRLGVTPVAVRQHLQALSADGLVEAGNQRRNVGRPARVWSLSPSAAARFPDSHSDLTVELIAAVRSTFGEDGLDRLVAERTRRQRESYAARLPGPDAPIDRKLDALSRIRSEEGYMCEWRREGDGSFVLAENHCPICAAATACQGFCRDELSMFREVLGQGVTVERTEHVLAGARRCAYRIELVAGASSARGAGPDSRSSRSVEGARAASGDGAGIAPARRPEGATS